MLASMCWVCLEVAVAYSPVDHASHCNSSVPSIINDCPAAPIVIRSLPHICFVLAKQEASIALISVDAGTLTLAFRVRECSICLRGGTRCWCNEHLRSLHTSFCQVCLPISACSMIFLRFITWLQRFRARREAQARACFFEKLQSSNGSE